MDYTDFDLPETPAIKGKVSRAWRMVVHSRKSRRVDQSKARRRLRRAVRHALRTGDARHLPRPFGPWEIN